MVKIQFPVLEVSQMLAAKSSVEVPGVEGRGEVCKYPVRTTARDRIMGLGTSALGLWPLSVKASYDSLDHGSLLASVKLSQMPQAGVTAAFQGAEQVRGLHIDER